MTSAWICAIGWLSEKSSLTSCCARCGVFVSFDEDIEWALCGGKVGCKYAADRLLTLTVLEYCRFSALRRSCGSDSTVLGASIPLRLFSMKIGILTPIDVLIVPSMPLHFSSCLLCIMERKVTALTSSAESLTYVAHRARPIRIHCTGTRQGLHLLRRPTISRSLLDANEILLTAIPHNSLYWNLDSATCSFKYWPDWL